MSDEQPVSLDALEREETRLRERLAKIATFKQLARELDIVIPSVVPTPAPTPIASRAAPLIAERSDGYDGTVGSLIHCYRQDERSPYQQLKHSVRLGYDALLERIIDDIGKDRVADLNASRIWEIYRDKWAGDGKLAMGHSLVGKLRMLSTFGATQLKDQDSTLLSGVLGNIRLPKGKARSERLTEAQAKAICAEARKLAWNSLAVAQAFQFCLPELRQMDVIGEWVPIGELGMSEITRGGEKWLRGLRWEEIDENMILRRALTSGRRNQQKNIEVDLKLYPMVTDELNSIPTRSRSGAVVICEVNGFPWSAAEFRRKWRIVATKAGVPKSVRNMDNSRSKPTTGGGSESRAL
jgi:hypothetical protein